MKPGDFILTHGYDWIGTLIQLGQSLRFNGYDTKYAHWSHCALVVSEGGDLIESVAEGVVKSNISKYDSKHYTVVHIDATDTDRAQAVAYAERHVGSTYGYLNVISLGISLLTGLKFSFGFEGEMICSGLVAGALERCDIDTGRECVRTMPADLAKYFGVEIPADELALETVAAKIDERTESE